MSRVFLPQIPLIKGHLQDITDASRFGTLVVVFHPEDSKLRHESFADNVDERLPGILAHAARTLKDFNPDTDFLALSGAQFFVAVCMWVLGVEHQIKVLRYDRVEKGYYPVTLSHTSIEE